ncbi:MAG: hypothetical protein PHN84_02360 [Desulfuromonadaceae bacterium]|nr:hypothetical protein [Desulfuromonadaceae bacterium]
MTKYSVMFLFIIALLPLSAPLYVMAEDLSVSFTPVAEDKIVKPAKITQSSTVNLKDNGHLKEITLFTISNDGRLGLTGDEDENVFIWNIMNGELVRKLGASDRFKIRLTSAAFSPESSQVLWSRDFKIMPVLWDVESGRRLAVFSSRANGHNAPVIAVKFSKDGRYVATGDKEGFVVVWNRTARTVVSSFKAHSGEAMFIFFIPESNELVTAGSDGAVRLWDPTSTSEPLATLLEPSDDSVTALTGSVNGEYIYAALDNMTVKGWTVSSRSLRSTQHFNDRQINSIALSPDGDFMAIAEENESILMWSVRESKVAWEAQLDKSAIQLFFSSDGKQLFSSGGDRWIRKWDSASGRLLKKFGGASE